MDIMQLWINPPHSIITIILTIAGALGAILMLYGVLLEKEKKQDAVFAIGALCLFLYSLTVHNLIFMIAFATFFLTSAIEWYQIETGRHRHIKKNKQ